MIGVTIGFAVSFLVVACICWRLVVLQDRWIGTCHTLGLSSRTPVAQVWEHIKTHDDGYARLLSAVRRVYYTAHWTADRPCDEARLWTELRDAAGYTPGNAPKERMRDAK